MPGYTLVYCKFKGQNSLEFRDAVNFTLCLHPANKQLFFSVEIEYDLVSGVRLALSWFLLGEWKYTWFESGYRYYLAWCWCEIQFLCQCLGWERPRLFVGNLKLTLEVRVDIEIGSNFSLGSKFTSFQCWGEIQDCLASVWGSIVYILVRVTEWYVYTVFMCRPNIDWFYCERVSKLKIAGGGRHERMVQDI